jgi:DHA1 family inner membrane transport protein
MSPYMVRNVGLKESQLPAIYFCGGSFTVFTMNIIGRLSDRYGKLKMFIVMTLSSLVPTFFMTHLPHVSLLWVLTTTTMLMICMSGRFVPVMALITASVERKYRGSFMSINTSVQQFASGAASFLSGYILGQSSDGRITNFAIVGFLSMIFALTGVVFARLITLNPSSSETPLATSINLID